MNKDHSTDSTRRNFWQGLIHWLKALDQAVDYDPHEPIYRKFRQLEKRLGQLETKSGSGSGGPTPIKIISGEVQ